MTHRRGEEPSSQTSGHSSQYEMLRLKYKKDIEERDFKISYLQQVVNDKDLQLKTLKIRYEQKLLDIQEKAILDNDRQKRQFNQLLQKEKETGKRKMEQAHRQMKKVFLELEYTRMMVLEENKLETKRVNRQLQTAKTILENSQRSTKTFCNMLQTTKKELEIAQQETNNLRLALNRDLQNEKMCSKRKLFQLQQKHLKEKELMETRWNHDKESLQMKHDLEIFRLNQSNPLIKSKQNSSGKSSENST